MSAAEKSDRRAKQARENADFKSEQYHEREAEKMRNYEYSRSQKNASILDLLFELFLDDK